VSGECPSCGYESCVGTSLAYCDAQNTILTELTELRRVRELAGRVVARGYFEDRYHFIVDGDLLRELRDALAAEGEE
jgi:hypothetical protein